VHNLRPNLLKTALFLILGFISILFIVSKPSLASSNKIINIYDGDHHEKVRIVLEAKKPIRILRAKIESGNFLSIVLKNTSFNNDIINLKQPIFDKKKVSLNRVKGNFVFRVKLSHRSQILRYGKIKKNTYRLFIDLKKSNKSSKKIITKKKPIVLIDPGHGGRDPGAIGSTRKTKEKNITLRYARELKKSLDKGGKFKAILTRDSDKFIPLRERVEMSKKYKADLFISIHADSAHNSKARGASIYTLSEKSSDKEANELAARENKADILHGVKVEENEVLDVLVRLSQRKSMNQSVKFAKILGKYFEKNKINFKRGHRFANFRVLKSIQTPSVLIEVGFISNKYDEKYIIGKFYMKKIIDATNTAIAKYFAKQH
jgi:N-acetylmuramoyl-L-alanine amidase